MEKGRIIINTGNGKGKTTAALGTAVRALGNGKKICIIQFIKSGDNTGEYKFLNEIKNLDWHIKGKGFVFNKKEIEKDRNAAREGLKLAEEIISCNKYDLVILDEITYLSNLDFVSVEEIVKIIINKPEETDIIMTGRDADEKLVEIADTVSEINPVKHAFDSGIKAKRGIEF